MKKLLAAGLVALSALALAATATPKVDGKIGTGEYANSFKQPDSGIVINWTIAGDTIYFGIESKSSGWTGIGFNPSGNKKSGAHMVMWSFENNKLSIRDMYMTRPTGAPTPVEQGGGKSSILASAGTVNGENQVVEFSRKLAANNPKTDVTLVQGKENTILLATGNDTDRQHARNSRWIFQLNLK